MKNAQSCVNKFKTADNQHADDQATLLVEE